MLGLKILFYVIAVLMFLVCFVAFINATAKDRPMEDKRQDLMVGTVVFALFLLLVKVFGGIL